MEQTCRLVRRCTSQRNRTRMVTARRGRNSILNHGKIYMLKIFNKTQNRIYYGKLWNFRFFVGTFIKNRMVYLQLVTLNDLMFTSLNEITLTCLKFQSKAGCIWKRKWSNRLISVSWFTWKVVYVWFCSSFDTFLDANDSSNNCHNSKKYYSNPN